MKLHTQRISEVKVLQSAAGYYIGTLYSEDGEGWVPYERLSDGYYPTYEAAQNALLTGDY